MVYLSISLAVIVILLSVYLLFIRRGLSDAVQQMEDIEKHPDRNRKLKAITEASGLEKLLNRINYIYQARQQERIIYQRSETKIRREIENISHDLRTPLTSILGYLDLLEDSTSEEEKAQYLEVIRKRAKVLQGFIQDFYEISRIEGDDYPLLLDALAVQSMLKDTMVAYYHEFERKKLEVSVELEERPAIIIADKIQFNRILNNLVQNALKYAEEEFILRQFCSRGSCVLQFINDRNKIPEQDIGFIFERFYTGDQSRSSQSTGLGLTITKTLVEKMNGVIEARFEGKHFVIELRWPMKQVAADF